MATMARFASSASDLVSEVPVSRWNAAHPPVELPPGVASRARHGAFVDGAQLFDHGAFHISLAEAAAADPQQRLVLEHGYAALHAMGSTKDTLLGSGTGAAVGIYATEFAQVLASGPLASSVYASTGASLSVACGRMSFTLGVHGPCASFETACSASLVACHSALRALQHYECDAHLACLLYTSPSPRDGLLSRMPSSA